MLEDFGIASEWFDKIEEYVRFFTEKNILCDIEEN